MTQLVPQDFQIMKWPLPQEARKIEKYNLSNAKASWQQSTLLATLGLGICDGVDDQANATLGDDVGDAVAHLNRYNCMRTREANHWKDVDNWVGQPAHNCPVLGTLV